jgi:hypothetical protein
MADLCDFCCKLVLHDYSLSVSFYQHQHLRELSHRTDQLKCPFCAAFLEVILAEHPNINLDTLCSFTAEHSDGLINLWIDFFVLSDRFFWAITYAEGKLEYTTTVERRIDCYTVDHLGAGKRSHERPDWRSSTVDFPTRFDSVDAWLQKCVSERKGAHQSCSRRIIIEGYPTRLLKLDEVETSGKVQLVDTKVLSDPKPNYITLSHCWGPPNGPRPQETRKANLEAHATGIPMESLPRTFRDTVRIALRLHQKFLWIDSLCIIQDDKADWEYEANIMAAIYGNSLLTIAATSSINCESGCNLERRSSRTIEGTATSVPGSFPNYRTGFDFNFKLKRNEGLQLLWQGRPPLHTRGWVMQEALLSPRILHMATQQMIWQCREEFAGEDIDGLSANRTASHLQESGFLWQQNRRLRHGWEFWWKIAEQYAQMKFTYQSDRLPALAGIIQLQAARLADKPLLGLWEKTIAKDLGWGHTGPQKSRSPDAPTWSWLFSEATGIRGPSHINSDMLQLQAFDIIWQGEPYVSELIRSTLTVKTRIFETPLHIAYGKSTAVKKTFYKSVMRPYLRNAKDRATPLRSVYLDYSSDIVMSKNAAKMTNVAYMLLGTWKYPSHPTHQEGWYDERVRFLVLFTTPEKPQSYLRLGCGSASVSQTKEESEPDCVGGTNLEFREHILQTWKEATIQLC